MANVKTFRDLIAWQKGMSLARMVYQQTRKMPKVEQFGLTLQMRRAAVSVPSNIAEGFGRESTADMLKFLRISRGSLNELSTQYELATSLQMITADQSLLNMTLETDRVLQGLIKSLEKKKK